jgi:hypothetical protein
VAHLLPLVVLLLLLLRKKQKSQRLKKSMYWMVVWTCLVAEEEVEEIIKYLPSHAFFPISPSLLSCIETSQPYP